MKNYPIFNLHSINRANYKAILSSLIFLDLKTLWDYHLNFYNFI